MQHGIPDQVQLLYPRFALEFVSSRRVHPIAATGRVERVECIPKRLGQAGSPNLGQQAAKISCLRRITHSLEIDDPQSALGRDGVVERTPAAVRRSPKTLV